MPFRATRGRSGYPLHDRCVARELRARGVTRIRDCCINQLTAVIAGNSAQKLPMSSLSHLHYLHFLSAVVVFANVD